jgi:pyridine nucleotide-disulfide oxidoreductase family protein
MPPADHHTNPHPGPRQLVLLGAGHAHRQVLQHLSTHPLPGLQVTLVAPHPRQVYPAMVPGFVAGHYALDDCLMHLDALVRRSGVRWLQHHVRALSAQTQTITLDDASTLHYDWLSVNTGAVQNREQLEQSIPGSRTHALFVRPLEAFGSHWPRIAEMGDARALRVAVIGGGATGVELALAVRHRLGGASVTLVCGVLAPMADFPAAVQQCVAHILKTQRITVLRDVALAITPEAVQLGCGAALACDVPLLATGVQAPSWLADSGLALDDAGFIAVDMYQRSTSHSRVFAAGDVSTRIDLVLPRSGVYAQRAALPLAHNLASAVANGALTPHMPTQRSLSLVSLGARRALASWGPWSAQGRWVWWLKNWLDRRHVAGFGSTNAEIDSK